ncbi:MAG: hypothetical protein A4S12_00495 [Proteobacteria bacterium SG_bin5]|nr:MAG: hypothetical protein A4S12_00495 [Proteobacteria bacterium SG_bin5]
MRRGPVGKGLSLPAEAALAQAEVDLGRRLVLGGLAGAATILSARPIAARQLPAERTTSSPEGIIRTLLERHEDSDGNLFELILDRFPPGIIVPVHHHPVVGLNYVLGGVAHSQYDGEPMQTLKAGDSFQDHAHIPHLLFRNPDRQAPVTILISHVLKKGQSFFIPGRN